MLCSYRRRGLEFESAIGEMDFVGRNHAHLVVSFDAKAVFHDGSQHRAADYVRSERWGAPDLLDVERTAPCAGK